MSLFFFVEDLEGRECVFIMYGMFLLVNGKEYSDLVGVFGNVGISWVEDLLMSILWV